jgi:hypothetical protein
MGWSFRRSIRLGPIRLNMSKSGLGYSIGGTGFRIGQDAKGRQYTQTSIPGTGIYNRSYTNKSTQGNASGSKREALPVAVGVIVGILWVLYKLFF